MSSQRRQLPPSAAGQNEQRGARAAVDKQERLLSVAAVAERLDISEDLARDVMKRLRPVRIGLGKRQLLRVRERVLDRWIQTGGDESWLTSSSEDASSGLKAKIATASGGTSRPSNETQNSPKLLPRSSVKSSFSTPIKPATKPRSSG